MFSLPVQEKHLETIPLGLGPYRHIYINIDVQIGRQWLGYVYIG